MTKEHYTTKRLTLQGFLDRAHDVHGYRYDYSRVEYENFRTPVTIGCPVHGFFEQKPG